MSVKVNGLEIMKVAEGQGNGTAVDSSYNLAIAIMEGACNDFRKCLRLDIRFNQYSHFNRAKKSRYGGYDYIQTSKSLKFFASTLCSDICGSIDPWYIIERITKEENYPFMKELKEEYEGRLK
jgi:hypothetical protein